jgi:xanthine/CO dehydrogenase XdhC/CoxF family maturation factor
MCTPHNSTLNIMSEHITNESYVASVRMGVVDTARLMLGGQLNFLEGARVLSSLRHEAAVRDDDPDFMTFVVIDSETDDPPIGTVRQHWSKEALEKLESECKDAEVWAKKIGTEACESLIRRFHV